eukprot:gene37260-45234_t
MEALRPPPPPFRGKSQSKPVEELPKGRWETIEPRVDSALPCQRSLHAGAVWKDSFVIFGGYDGSRRVNDLYSYNFKENMWRQLNSSHAPCARDRHVAVVYEDSLYIFGGFDGTSRVNDLHRYNFITNTWYDLNPPPPHAHAHTNPPHTYEAPTPSPRHSHSAVVYRDSMYVFGGYDGAYKNDFHALAFASNSWRPVGGGTTAGEVPRARYRGTCIVHGDSMILHGGHDGNRHLQDTHIFDFITSTWSALLTEGLPPSPRDSHVCVLYNNSMFLYGGSTGTAMGDFYALSLDLRRDWAPVPVGSSGVAGIDVTPGPRFCHVGVVYEGAFYIFGGYDGSNRLNDFLRYRFEGQEALVPSPSTIVSAETRIFVCVLFSLTLWCVRYPVKLDS